MDVGQAVKIEIPRTRPRIGDTRQIVSTMYGTYVGPVPFETTLVRVRVNGEVRKVGREYVTERADAAISASGPCTAHNNPGHPKCVNHDCCIGHNAHTCRAYVTEQTAGDTA